ncbi:CFEM domain-containing [Venturia nashicola]|uniref:CFEM domain-containing n=1 Tax=Venturia nashicola TaxID=86259 RepID=A0A4Z1PRC3_9PEZI|nr:CFEM domain-containing [Venturia nashicola]TLD38607.1 CFEM domain-containing [Venturia nashicola]
MKFILALVALCATSVVAQDGKCAKEAAAVPACGQKCIEEAAATVGCKAKDFDCYCKNAEKYAATAGKCLIGAPCRSQAMATKTASDAVCLCVKGSGPPPALRRF